MSAINFIGRKQELIQLNALLTKKVASLVVVRGRRRIGKSRLIEEFAKNKTFYSFSGLAPDVGVSAQQQRDEFALQLSQQTGLPEIKADDWTKLFQLLAEKTKTGRVVVLLDEITWMAHGDPTFLSKLKNAWDLYFKKNNKLIFILCGSISAWIEANIINSTGFFGRIALSLVLSELSVRSCVQILDKLGFKRSAYEKQLYLNVSGGVPWYLELIDPKLSAEANIVRLCFESNGLLVQEFDRIFHDLFGSRSSVYKQIVEAIALKPLDYSSIAKQTGYPKGSSLTRYIYELNEAGYIQPYNAWDLKTGLPTKKIRYKISDNYLRFYLKYIASKVEAIKAGRLQEIALAQLPGWHTVMGLQFENTVLANRQFVLERLGLRLGDVVNDGPYFQSKTARQAGCQIDYMVQTKLKTVFVCEIKFTSTQITTRVIAEMKQKITALKLPRGYAAMPVLIYFGDVDQNVLDADYFYQCIDWQV